MLMVVNDFLETKTPAFAGATGGQRGMTSKYFQSAVECLECGPGRIYVEKLELEGFR